MMLVQEAIHQLRLFTRRPAAVFFVVAMPLVLLIVLTQLFGNEKIQGLGLNTAQFYTPALAVFGVVMACFTYLAVSTATARDPVSYTHLTLPTITSGCRSRWSPYH